MDLLSGLNPEQKKGVLTTDGPVLIIAGAGSGKTRVLTHRIAHIIEQGNSPYSILAITFTNKAAKEMKERAIAITEDCRMCTISTFHSFCVRVLKRECEYIGMDKNFVIYDTQDSVKVVTSIIKDLSINKDKYKPSAVFSAISRFKDQLVSVREAKNLYTGDFYMEKIVKVYEEYEKRMKKFNAIDFNDILIRVVELFASNKEVLDRYQNYYKYILVDEYQDTNMVQYELIKMLAKKNKNICVVGDDDQSIYSFRGACVDNILEFEKDYDNCTIIKLEQNYRSSSKILDAGNEVIKNNSKRKSKTLWTSSDEGEPITLHTAQTDVDEAKFVVQKIKDTGTRDTYHKFAVLYRNNSQSSAIEDMLVKNNIPYQLFGGTRFYDRKEIKDILAYLKFIHNPSDEMSLRRIVNEPKRSIGDATLEKVSALANEQDVSMFDIMREADKYDSLARASKKLMSFSNMILNLKENEEHMGVDELLIDLFEVSGYEDELLKENTEQAHSRIDNIYELVSKAKEFHANFEDGTLGDFLEEVSLVADIDNYDENASKVALMTIHSSKGLEFENVFLVGCEENLFPSYRSIESMKDSDIEEERRLMYVAITRAKEKLYITNALRRMLYGKFSYNSNSRFVKEIPTNDVEIDGLTVSKTENKMPVKDVINQTSRNYKPTNDKLSAYLSTNKSTDNSKTLDFEVSDKVKHLKYGVCEVMEIKPAGADFQVKLRTQKGDEKSVMGILSKLKKV